MHVEVVDRQRSRRIGRIALAAFVGRVARAIAPESATEVTVALVSDRRMRELNRTWRGIDRTTDVLSFPAGPDGPASGDRSLGDIVISVPRAAEQARRAGHSLARELRILAIHGFLHLAGHDHETDDGTMMRLQRRLVRTLAPRNGRSTR